MEDDRDEGKLTFPQTLYSLLSDQTNSALIEWSCDHAFLIKNVDRFSSEIMPKLFGHTNFSSFIRLLNCYAFKRTKNKRTECEYRHPIFIRGRHDLLQYINRKNANFFKAYTAAAGDNPPLLTHEKATLVAEAAAAQGQVNVAPIIASAASATAAVINVGNAHLAGGAGHGLPPLGMQAGMMVPQDAFFNLRPQQQAPASDGQLDGNLVGLLSQLASQLPAHMAQELTAKLEASTRAFTQAQASAPAPAMNFGSHASTGTDMETDDERRTSTHEGGRPSSSAAAAEHLPPHLQAQYQMLLQAQRRPSGSSTMDRARTMPEGGLPMFHSAPNFEQGNAYSTYMATGGGSSMPNPAFSTPVGLGSGAQPTQPMALGMLGTAMVAQCQAQPQIQMTPMGPVMMMPVPMAPWMLMGGQNQAQGVQMGLMMMNQAANASDGSAAAGGSGEHAGPSQQTTTQAMIAQAAPHQAAAGDAGPLLAPDILADLRQKSAATGQRLTQGAGSGGSGGSGDK